MNDKNIILITGANGFIGSHLLNYYVNYYFNYKIIALYHSSNENIFNLKDKIDIVKCDITDKLSLNNLIQFYQPSTIFHLAARSNIAESWIKDSETNEVNVTGTINLLEAIINLRSINKDYSPKILIASSGSVYGNIVSECDINLEEDYSTLPTNNYSKSKLEQEKIALHYSEIYNLKIIITRIFNTSGPRKNNDVLNDFVKRSLEIKKGISENMKCGNLSSKRAILDIRDLISAFILLVNSENTSNIYNISSGKIYQIAEIIPLIEEQLQLKIETNTDSSLLRPTDDKILIGNTNKLKLDTGWIEKFSIIDTIQSIINFQKQSDT